MLGVNVTGIMRFKLICISVDVAQFINMRLLSQVNLFSSQLRLPSPTVVVLKHTITQN